MDHPFEDSPQDAAEAEADPIVLPVKCKGRRTCLDASRRAGLRLRVPAPDPPMPPVSVPAGPDREPSLRSWLRQLEIAGRLRRVRAEVEGNEEIGAISRVNLALEGPALLFDKITGRGDVPCRRVMTCGLGDRSRLLLMAGLPRDTSDAAIVRHLKAAYDRPLLPVHVETGPVKRNVVAGAAIPPGLLSELARPRVDGRRSDLLPFCAIVTRDAETGAAIVRLYRGEPPAHTENSGMRTGGSGRRPVAIVLGWHDAMPFCAGSPFPSDNAAWGRMGAVLGRSVELVRCETVDLEVPASAEIVVEGHMAGGSAEPHGAASRAPAVEISCITYRDDPILRLSPVGARPGFPSEDWLPCAYSWSAMAWALLERRGVDGVTDVWMPPAAAGASIAVQIRKGFPGQAERLARTLWESGADACFFRNVMVAEEDIDIRDPEALGWALAFGVGGDAPTRIFIDATGGGRGLGPRQEASANAILDPALERRVRERWGEYALGLRYLDEEPRARLTAQPIRRDGSEA